MAELTLEQIDHALEWHVRRLVTRAGYWPDIEPLLATNATPQQLAQAKAAIKAQGRELIEVFGPAPWSSRGQMKGNNFLVSRLTTGTGSYGLAEPVAYDPVDAQDLSQGYTQMLLADAPQNIRYELRFVGNDTKMDRVSSTLALQAFGVRRYLYGMDDELKDTANGFWVVPMGDSLDMSEDDFIERVLRFEVLDVQLIPGIPMGHVPAAVTMGLDVQTAEELISTELEPES